MSKYQPLTGWLRKQAGKSVTLTFAQIEKIIGDNLPPSTRRWFRFWENGPGTVQSDAWDTAGFQTVMVDLENEEVRFKRIQEV